MKKTKSSKKTVIILIVILFIFIGAVAAGKFLTRTKFNDTLVYGNSAGNFYNGGLFCEIEDMVYFSNPYDNFSLYQMTSGGQEAKLVTPDCATYINADSNYLYYVRNNGSYNTAFAFLKINTDSLCRVDRSGKRLKILDAAPSLYATLIGNYVYYIHYDQKSASTTYKVKIDGKEKEQISKSPMLLSPSSNGNLYYSGVESDHYLRTFNTSSDTGSVYYEGITFNPVDSGNFIYFMDCENDYHVSRISKSDRSVSELTDCRVDTYNVTQNYVYYQKSDPDNPALCRIPKNGSGEEEIVANGIFCDINVTSRNVYFRSYESPGSFFQTPADGPVSVTPFSFEEAE